MLQPKVAQNVWSYEANGSGAQKWNISANGDGSYRIENAPSKKVLDVENGNAAEGNNVQQYAWNGSAAQKWYISYGGSGGFYLESALNRKFVLSIENGSPVNGANYVSEIEKTRRQPSCFRSKKNDLCPSYAVRQEGDAG